MSEARHDELSALLEAVAVETDFPATPDLRLAVRARIAAPPSLRERSFFARPAVGVAGILAALVAMVSVSLPARQAVADRLGLDGIRIEFDEIDPQGLDGPGLFMASLGRRVTDAQAQEAVGFELRGPDGAVGSIAIYLDPTIGDGGMVSTVFRSVEGQRLRLISEFRASVEGNYLKKIAGGGTDISVVAVGGSEGYWISGSPHAFGYVDGNGFHEETVRLAGDVLLWDSDGITYRVEGADSLGEALEIARKMGF